jgi:integrase
MTIEEALADLRDVIGQGWPKMIPLPEEPVVALCEALWIGGIRPSHKTVAPHFPGISTRSFVDGMAAWRRRRGFKVKARYPQQNIKEDLIPHIAPEIASAPLTCFDPDNDGRWPSLAPKVIGYIRAIENQSLRNTVALFVGIRAERKEQLYLKIVGYVSAMRVAMNDLGEDDITTIDPDDMFRRLRENRIVSGLTGYQLAGICGYWNAIRNCFDDYAERLTEAQRQTMSKFFIRRIVDQRKISMTGEWTAWNRQRKARVKAKTDTVHNRFHHLRHLAKARLNQIKRMHRACKQAISTVEANRLSLPYHFSYEETAISESGRQFRQCVHLTLWDTVSRWDRLVELGYGSVIKRRMRRRLAGEFSPENNTYHVEHHRTESSVKDVRSTEPWFLELCENYVFSDVSDTDLVRRRVEFYRRWGYDNSDHWYMPRRIIGWSCHLAEWACMREKGGHLLFSVEGLLVAALFAHLVIRIQTITGARLGEIQQIAQNPDCIKQLTNVGPKAETRWLLRLVPKGGAERQNYYIDERTKDDLMEVIAFLREEAQTKKLQVVAPEFSKSPPDRYVFQWAGKHLDQCTLNSVIRFLLHGAIVRTSDGQGVHLTSHILRHAFATEMAGLKVSVDVIAAILHQRDTSVTKYYSQPTATQVSEAAEMIFVDRIDVAAEALRSPIEIGRMLDEATGRVGALTEVIGGTCIVANLCPAKFACIGCSGNAPDPAKRYQIEQKMAWATEHALWSAREKLLPEERRLNQVVQDCALMLEEMSLIEQATKDSEQTIEIVASETASS